MESKTEPFKVEEKTINLSSRAKTKKGFYLEKNHAIILAAVISFLFVGAILATYFGKPQTVNHQYPHTSGV